MRRPGGLADRIEQAAGAVWLAPARFTMMALSSPWVITYHALRLYEARRDAKEALCEPLRSSSSD